MAPHLVSDVHHLLDANPELVYDFVQVVGLHDESWVHLSCFRPPSLHDTVRLKKIIQYSIL